MSPAASGSSPLAGRRRQAAHNDTAIMAAARAVFLADPRAPVSAVAAAAGVGISALYRRYPGKEDLLRTLCHDGLLTYIAEAEAADAEPGDWTAFAVFLRRIVDADVHSLTVHLAGTFTPTAEMSADAERSGVLTERLLARARRSGRLRADVVADDLTFLLEGAAAIRLPGPARTAEVRRRYVTLFLDALSSPEPSGLPGPPPAPGELNWRWRTGPGGPRPAPDTVPGTGRVIGLGSMRFGVFVPQGWRLDLAGVDPANHWDIMLDVARAAEDGPFESIWVYDHFHTVPVPTEEATHEAWTLMAAFGAATRRVRLGQMCTCMGYRSPAYLAKVAATVDVVSGGRTEMGIGAGWYEHEWRAYGYGFPPAGERLGMLDEGVQIMRQLWTTGTATLNGQHYQVNGAISRPLPLQDGGIPLWIAGGGEKKTLRIAAKYASYTNFDTTPEVFRRKSEILAAHCAEVGTDFSAIVRSGNYNVIIGETESEVTDRLAWLRSHYAPYLPEDQVERTIENLRRGPLVGTPEQIVERLTEANGLGMTYAILYLPEIAHDRAGFRLFAEKVIPELASL